MTNFKAFSGKVSEIITEGKRTALFIASEGEDCEICLSGEKQSVWDMIYDVSIRNDEMYELLKTAIDAATEYRNK